MFLVSNSNSQNTAIYTGFWAILNNILILADIGGVLWNLSNVHAKHIVNSAVPLPVFKQKKQEDTRSTGCSDASKQVSFSTKCLPFSRAWSTPQNLTPWSAIFCRHSDRLKICQMPKCAKKCKCTIYSLGIIATYIISFGKKWRWPKRFQNAVNYAVAFFNF